MGITMSERDLQRAVEHCAALLGWRRHHHWLSARSSPGWPDLVLCRPPRLLFAELKRDGREPTEAQRRWLDDLAACGAETAVWTPADWHAGTIEQALR